MQIEMLNQLQSKCNNQKPMNTWTGQLAQHILKRRRMIQMIPGHGPLLEHIRRGTDKEVPQLCIVHTIVTCQLFSQSPSLPSQNPILQHKFSKTRLIRANQATVFIYIEITRPHAPFIIRMQRAKEKSVLSFSKSPRPAPKFDV